MISSSRCFTRIAIVNGLKTRSLATTATVSTTFHSSQPVKKCQIQHVKNAIRFQQVCRQSSQALQTARPMKHPYANHPVNYSPLNATNWLDRTARLMPNRTAIEYGSRKTSYADMRQRVLRGATKLQQMGIQPGDRVATLLPNIPAGLELNFIIPLMRGVLTTINSRLNIGEITYILEHSEPKVLFVDQEYLQNGELAKVCERLKIEMVVTDDTGSPTDGYEQWLQSCKSPNEWSHFPGPEHEDELFSLNYTSGTTGNPKAVAYNYRGHYLMAMNNIVVLNLNKNSKMIMIVPLFHCNGWCYPWSLVAQGATAIALRKIDYDVIWDHLKNGATHYNAAPTVQNFLVNNPNAVRLKQKVFTGTGGSAPSARLLKELMDLNITLTHVYGLTETFGPACINQFDVDEAPEMSIDDVALQLSRPGQNILCSDDIKVASDDMMEVPWDGQTIGELVFRGNLVMKEYYKNPKATAEAFRGGWFHSGDLAVRHPDGNIEIVDRLKDIIVSGGENISSVEVEKAIVSHPKVLEVAVVATKDDTWGERPKAFVVIKPDVLEHGGYQPGDLERELIDHCRKQLAGYKIPSRIQLEVEPLPKTASGKIKKHELKAREWGNSTKLIN